ncbi:hypothetical protein NEIRO02_0988 [Nematocida sp. AWRm79]|nr:hypothetical protein NEIRO02_0988 [Nematocida sp. AWRm79]
MKRSNIFIFILILTAGIGVPAAFLFIRRAKKTNNNRNSENIVNTNTVLKAEEARTEQENKEQVKAEEVKKLNEEQVRAEQEKSREEQLKKEQERTEEVPYIVDDMGFIRFNSSSSSSSESNVHNNVEQEQDEHASAHYSNTEQDEHVSTHYSNTEQEEHVSAQHSNTEQEEDETVNKPASVIEYVKSIFTKPSEEPVNDQSPAETEDKLDTSSPVDKKEIKPEDVNTQVEKDNTSVEDNTKSEGFFSRLANTFSRKSEEPINSSGTLNNTGEQQGPIIEKPENPPTGEIKLENNLKPDEIEKKETTLEPENQNTITEEATTKSGGFFSRLSNPFSRKSEEPKEEPIIEEKENSPTEEIKFENNPTPDKVEKKEPEPENPNIVTTEEDTTKSGGFFSRLANSFSRKSDEPILEKSENPPTEEIKSESPPAGEAKSENILKSDEVEKKESAPAPESENLNTPTEEDTTKSSSLMGYITSFFNTSNVSPDEKESHQLNSFTPSYTEDNEADEFISNDYSNTSSESINNHEPSDNNNVVESISEQSIESNSGFNYGNSMPF